MIQSHIRSLVPKRFARAVDHPSLSVSYEATFHLVQTLMLIMWWSRAQQQHHRQAQNFLLLPHSLKLMYVLTYIYILTLTYG